jgi:hypothetical protein
MGKAVYAARPAVSFQHPDLDRVVDGRVVNHMAESGWLGVLLDWASCPCSETAVIVPPRHFSVRVK